MDIELIVKLASDFEEAAKTLRSGELPSSKPKQHSKIEVVEPEPMSSDIWLNQAKDNLLIAKDNIDSLIGKISSDKFEEVIMLFHSIRMMLSSAESYYEKVY